MKLLIKEAEMRAIKLACVVAVLSVSTVMATDAVVTWTPRGIATNNAGDVTYDLNNIPDTGDRWITWTDSVRVTGDNLGLAGFNISLGVQTISPQNGVPDGLGHFWATHPFPDASDGSRSWVQAYKTGAASGGTLVQDGSSGGPGLSSVQKLGYQDTTLSYISQMGAGFTDFTPFNKPSKTWVGNQTWGVGLDSRKTNMLVDPSGLWDVETGYFDLTGWATGTYRVDLLVTGSAVIQSGLSLNTGPTQNGVTWDVPAANLVGQSFTFTITPEPATMLLLAGAGLLIRRRRA